MTDEAEVQCLMWLVRWAIRQYRGHRQWEDLLSAAYCRAWVSVAAARAAGSGEDEGAMRATKAAIWGAKDWLRSGANETRTAVRSHSRMIALPERVGYEEGIWERDRQQGTGNAWVDRLVEALDDEECRGSGSG